MITFKIKQHHNEKAKYLLINEGHINLNNGLRFVYEVQDENKNVLDKDLYVINGDDFDDLGKSDEIIRLAILKHLLHNLNCELII